MRRHLAAILVGLSGAICAPAFGQSNEAQTRIVLHDLSIGKLEFLASQLVANGRSGDALKVTDELLLREPGNALAHYINGQIMLASGRTDIARHAAWLSFSEAKSKRQSYEAARLAGRVAVQDRRWLAAQYWTRQTYQHAPDKKRREIAADDFRKLRAISPWRASVKIGFKPSNNVNGGADERYNVIDGVDAVGILSRDAMALSGVIGTVSAQASYRIAQSPKSETRLGVDAFARRVNLSGNPSVIRYSPTGIAGAAVKIHNSTYAASALGLTLSHARAFEEGLFGNAALRAGQVWQGGVRSYRYRGLNLGITRALKAGPVLGLTGDIEARDWPDGTRHDIQRQVSLSFSRRTDSGRLIASAGVTDLASSWSQAGSYTVAASVGYELARQIGPLSLSVTGGLSRSVYPDYSVLFMAPSGGRQDKTVFGEIGIWSPDLNYVGFAPELKLQATHVESNVSRFSRTELSVAMGWRSTF